VKARTPTSYKTTHQNSKQRTYAGARELGLSEIGLKTYTKAVSRELFRPYGQNKPCGLVVDFGAGMGQLASLFEQKYSTAPLCVEIDPDLESNLKRHGFPVVSSLEQTQRSSVYFVYSSNVLEHIEDDVSILSEFSRVLQVGSFLALFVPALPSLYSQFDSNVGHYRRYKKTELRSKVIQAGFEIESIRYFDCIGVFPWALMKWFKVGTNTKLGVTLLMHLYDKFVFPLSFLFDKLGMSRVIGKNLVVIARKTADE
jgi:hypothetical protein